MYCEFTCVTGQYANLNNDACLACDTSCCSDCRIDRESVGNDIVCDNFTDLTKILVAGVCTDPSLPSASTPNDPDYHLLNQSTRDVKKITILFDNTPTSFDLATNMEINTERGWTSPNDFTSQLNSVADINGKTAYELIITPTVDQYNEKFLIRLKDIDTTKDDGSGGTIAHTYEDKIIEIRIYRYKTFNDIDVELEQTISKVSYNVAEYSMILGIAMPSIAGILIPLNVLRMLVLIPTRITFSPIHLLKLFVTFEESDPIALISPDKFYAESK